MVANLPTKSSHTWLPAWVKIRVRGTGRLGPNLIHKDKPNPNFDPIIFIGIFFYLLYPLAVFSGLAQTKCLQYQFRQLAQTFLLAYFTTFAQNFALKLVYKKN